MSSGNGVESGECKECGVTISGPAALLHEGTKDLPGKYIRDRICLVREVEENIDTGAIITRWYLDEMHVPEAPR